MKRMNLPNGLIVSTLCEVLDNDKMIVGIGKTEEEAIHCMNNNPMYNQDGFTIRWSSYIVDNNGRCTEYIAFGNTEEDSINELMKIYNK